MPPSSHHQLGTVSTAASHAHDLAHPARPGNAGIDTSLHSGQPRPLCDEAGMGSASISAPRAANPHQTIVSSRLVASLRLGKACTRPAQAAESLGIGPWQARHVVIARLNVVCRERLRGEHPLQQLARRLNVHPIAMCLPIPFLVFLAPPLSRAFSAAAVFGFAFERITTDFTGAVIRRHCVTLSSNARTASWCVWKCPISSDTLY